jgi:hypothetical protein
MFNFDEEIDEFLKNENKLKFLVDFLFSETETANDGIQLEPPIKKGMRPSNDRVVYAIKKSKKNGTKLF